MKKQITWLVLASMLLPNISFGKGRLQDADHKSLAEITAAGGTAAGLLNDTKIYVSANGLNKQLSAAITSGDIGGGGSGKNYLTGATGTAESNATTGWATYADAAGASPVDGTGGSPNITFTATATTPLTGTYSYLITKDAVNRQGQGVCYAFSPDKADKDAGKVVRAVFDYQIVSGTYADGDVTFWFVDVTNGTVIQPSASSLLNITGASQKQPIEVQLPTNSSSLRFCAHISTTSASAYTIKLDSIVLGPDAKSYGPPVTDAKDYTPSGANQWTGNATYTGSWSRVGDHAEFDVLIAGSTTPTGGDTSNAKIYLPAGMAIDFTKLKNNGTNGSVVGYSSGSTAGGNHNGEVRIVNATTTDQVNIWRIDPTSGTAANSTAPLAAANIGAAAYHISAKFRLPILGWSSSVQVSSDADTREVSATYTSATGETLAANDKINFNTKVKDTHSAVTTGTNSWVFTAPMPGRYDVLASVYQASATFRGIYVTQNGTAKFRGYTSGANNGMMVAVGRLDLVAGDTVSIKVDGAITLTADNSYNMVAISRVSGPSQIAASESIQARYMNGGQSIANGATPVVDFATKTFDSHGSATTGASWKFTAQVAGKYDVYSSLWYDSASFSAGSDIQLLLFKNGVQYSTLDRHRFAAAYSDRPPLLNGSDEIDLIAGDYIDIRTSHGETTARSVFTSTNENRVVIKRTGN